MEETKSIAPYPPKSVRVDIKGRQASVNWKLSNDEKVVAYEIYRSVNGGPLEAIVRMRSGPYVEKIPARASIDYAVAAVDHNNNVSPPRKAGE